jgi:subtilisin family serine protease
MADGAVPRCHYFPTILKIMIPPMSMKRILFTLFIIIGSLQLQAQSSGMGKLSPWLRQLSVQERHTADASLQRVGSLRSVPHEVCAFVRLSADDEEVLQQYGCQSLTKVGNIHVANIPVGQLQALSRDPRVLRIEARPMGQALLDTLSLCINAASVHKGTDLPQAYTGKGVVVGVMDIGFDLTHPTFYSRDLSEYRIKALWDMLSRDTVGSAFPVGRDFVGTEALQALAHSYDGLHNTHGTHTAGIAAGSGYDSPYQGVAPEADICLVANAVGDNASLIDSALIDRFTFATDALGFKYLFDYAKQVDKPCVVSFSEGSSQDFWGYDQLYYETLDSLVGPGRILVAAAGNYGDVVSWFRKEPGLLSKGSFFTGSSRIYCTLKSPDDFLMRFVTYGNDRNDTLLVQASDVWNCPDSLMTVCFTGVDSLQIQAYPSCYVAHEVCFDLMFYHSKNIGQDVPMSLELVGLDADVEFWRGSLVLVQNTLNPALCAGEKVRNIHSPSSAPRVICVGATTYRDSIMNKNGEWLSYWKGTPGERAPFSSVGPTMDGRIKPDIMAPGNNIISSYSSFYLENHPGKNDIRWDVAEFGFNGRTYPWNANSGTSMSCPAVAGAVALWLQANPKLTPEDVKGIMQRTSRHPDPSLSYPNNTYGYGEIDVYRGLLDILSVDNIREVSLSHTPSRVRFSAGLLQVELERPLDAPFQLRLFSLSGRQVFSARLSAGQSAYTVTLPSLPAGIYAVQLDGSPQVSGSTLIRIL